jgi:hypothetical protein
MRCGNLTLRLFFRCFLLLALIALPLTPGVTPAWSQNSAPPSNSSAGHLQTWEELSGRFSQGLEQHEQTLKELGSKLETSEANGQRLTFLYEQLSAQNASLKTYNNRGADAGAR